MIRRDGPIAKLEIGSQLQIGVTSRELVSFPPTFTDASLSANMIQLVLQKTMIFSILQKSNFFYQGSIEKADSNMFHHRLQPCARILIFAADDTMENHLKHTNSPIGGCLQCKIVVNQTFITFVRQKEKVTFECVDNSLLTVSINAVVFRIVDETRHQMKESVLRITLGANFTRYQRLHNFLVVNLRSYVRA